MDVMVRVGRRPMLGVGRAEGDGLSARALAAGRRGIRSGSNVERRLADVRDDDRARAHEPAEGIHGHVEQVERSRGREGL